MENQEQDASPDYLKGFNEGYVLSRHMPELSEKLAKALPDDERSKGFKSGREELLKEHAQERYPSWLTKDRRQESVPDKTKSKDDPAKDKG